MGEGQAWADTGLTLGLSLRIGGGCESINPVDGSDGGTKRKKPFPAAIKFHDLFPPMHPKQEQEDVQEVSYRDDGSSSTRSVGDAATAAKRSEHQEEYKDDSADDGTNRRGVVTTSPIRKKLRLSKEQSTLLEDSFRKHPTLHPTQKLELAEKLNLQPRQIEVWFQNRRARTKLKQTEVDLEFLRRCCAALRDENTRLMGELHELRSSMEINGNTRPSTGNSAARPQKMAAVSCTSCMTAVESTPSGSGSFAAGEGGVTHGGAATIATAAARPLGLYKCRRAIKEGQIDRLRD